MSGAWGSQVCESGGGGGTIRPFGPSAIGHRQAIRERSGQLLGGRGAQVEEQMRPIIICCNLECDGAGNNRFTPLCHLLN